MPFLGTGHLWLLVIVLAIVMILWGPGKLPDVGAGLGRALREFRESSSRNSDSPMISSTPLGRGDSPLQVSTDKTTEEQA